MTQPAQPRTESLARELVRDLIGDAAGPWLEVERGAGAGARRLLPPPGVRFVIGRGDEATWMIADEDLSRAHVEIQRGWDGVAVSDLGSKNGSRVDGVKLGAAAVALRDGAELALGGVILRFRDPAERHLRGEPVANPAPRITEPMAVVNSAPAPATRRGPVMVFAAIAGLALGALVWVLIS